MNNYLNVVCLKKDTVSVRVSRFLKYQHKLKLLIN